jgi:hypothetical protein
MQSFTGSLEDQPLVLSPMDWSPHKPSPYRLQSPPSPALEDLMHASLAAGNMPQDFAQVSNFSYQNYDLWTMPWPW